MDNKTLQMIDTVAGVYSVKYPFIEKLELEQELQAELLHAKTKTYNPDNGEWLPYARAIVNRTALRHVFKQKCPVSGRMGDLTKWQSSRSVAIPLGDEEVDNGKRNATYQPVSRFTAADDILRTKEVVECLQQIFEASQEYGKLAKGLLLDGRKADDIAEEHHVSVWRVYRATLMVRKAIRENTQAQLLWKHQ